MNLLQRLIREEEGQGLIEYVLIVGLIALAVFGVIVLAGEELGSLWQRVADSIEEQAAKIP